MADRLLSLAPTADLDPNDPGFAAYCSHLDSIYADPSLRNIAMIGNRGSGKSSILRSYDKQKHGKETFLFVSLFDFEQRGNAEKLFAASEQTQKRLEYSLLCQILARCTKEDLRGSALKPIPEAHEAKSMGFWQYAYVFTALLLVFGLIFEDRFGAVLLAWGMSDGWRVGLHAFGYLAAFVMLFCGFLWVRQNYPGLMKLNKLTLQIAKVQAELAPSEDKYCLDQFKFELIHILEQISGRINCTVVFEDMEWLDTEVCVELMVKLRELNTLVNAHRATRSEGPIEPLRFIYPLSDAVFDDETRTKFFDTIMPVIPALNGTNARNTLEDLLLKNGINPYGELVVGLLDIIAPNLTDYRTLRNVISEFFLLQNLYEVNNAKDGHANAYASILALTVYKSLFPKEYHQAFTATGNAILPKPNPEKYNSSLVDMVDKLFGQGFLGPGTLDLIGYSKAQITLQWRSILRSDNTDAKHSLLMHERDLFSQKQENDLLYEDWNWLHTTIREALEQERLFETETDDSVVKLYGNNLFWSVDAALEQFITELSVPGKMTPLLFSNYLECLYLCAPFVSELEQALERVGRKKVAKQCLGYVSRFEGKELHLTEWGSYALRQCLEPVWFQLPEAVVCKILGNRPAQEAEQDYQLFRKQIP